jgi:hypothetical protein
MKKLLTTHQLMDFLQVSDATLAAYRATGMPYQRTSKRVIRYDVETVTAWLHARNLETTDTAEGNSLATAPVSSFNLPPEAVHSIRESLNQLTRCLMRDPTADEACRFGIASFALMEILYSSSRS